MGFPRANNRGIAASRGRYVLLLNSDTVALPTRSDMLVAFMDAHPEAGVVGPRLLRPDGTAQPYAFGGDPTLGYLLRRGFNRLLRGRYLHDWDTNTIQEVDWVSGACLMVRRAAIEQAGPLDEAMFMYFEDNEWCLRIRRAGWKVYYDPQAAIMHIGGQSLAKNPVARRAYREFTLFLPEALLAARHSVARRATATLSAHDRVHRLMPIYFDISAAVHHRAGLGRYAESLARELLPLLGDRLAFFYNRERGSRRWRGWRMCRRARCRLATSRGGCSSGPGRWPTSASTG